MKQITITVPDNYELKQDGNTYTIVEKENKVTYEDIKSKELPKSFYIKNDVECTTSRQYRKLLAINKLMNLAKWLNGGWQPDWRDINEYKYFIAPNHKVGTFDIEEDTVYQNSYIYFKLEELAQKAIEILGEETIKLALCTDY